MSFTIDSKGRVGSAKATGGTLTDATERSCVVKVFEAMTFPEPESPGTVTATATHVYEAN